MGRVLFLSGGENAFYDTQRNSYPGVHARRIFARNSRLFRLLRRIAHRASPLWIRFFFADWKYQLQDYEMIVLPVSIYSAAILAYVRRISGVRIVNWYWNPVSTTEHPDTLRIENSTIFSFDRSDCQAYGLNFAPTYYFSSISLPQKNIDYDLIFVGADKGRLQGLLSVEEELLRLGLRVRFHITSGDTKYPDERYPYKPLLSYEDILDLISRSVGIVDYVQAGQSGTSQRPMESIFLRKKLVTNDAGILDCDFYDSDNIFVLGLDNLRDLPAFLARPYRELNSEVRDRYDFGQWLKGISVRREIAR